MAAAAIGTSWAALSWSSTSWDAFTWSGSDVPDTGIAVCMTGADRSVTTILVDLDC